MHSILIFLSLFLSSFKGNLILGDDILLYIREISNKTQIYNSKYPNWINSMIYLVKCFFCILTVQEQEKCYIPYKQLKNKYFIKMIANMLAKQNQKLVLSNSLQHNKKFVQELDKHKVLYLKGEHIFEYNILNLAKYIGKLQNKEIPTMEVFLLINELTSLDLELIVFLAKQVKRLNIITKNISKFKKLEENLQNDFGINILVMNNKKKSLAKANIIINLDFKQENLTLYNINRKAMIISKIPIEINAKSFEGILIRDYNILFQEKRFVEDFYCDFENKVLLESILNLSKNYVEVSSELEQRQVEVTKLWGKNGEIRTEEIKNI